MPKPVCMHNCTMHALIIKEPSELQKLTNHLQKGQEQKTPKSQRELKGTTMS